MLCYERINILRRVGPIVPLLQHKERGLGQLLSCRFEENSIAVFRTPHPPVMEVLPVAVVDGCCRRRRRNNEVEEPFI